MNKKPKIIKTDLFLSNPYFYFTPQKDITTYELALCLQVALELINNKGFRYDAEAWIKEQGIERHFTMGDNGFTLIPDAEVGLL